MGRIKFSIRMALGLVLGAQLALATVAVETADAASVLCQKKTNKKKLRVREDACKGNEVQVEFGGVQNLDGIEDELADLDTRVDLVEEAATAPVTNDRLQLDTETIRVPGTEGEDEVTTERAHSVCALTRVLYFPAPEPKFQDCKVQQNGDGTWTISQQNSEMFCDAICF